VLPVNEPRPTDAPTLRTLSGLRRDDVLLMGGAAVSAASIGLLLFGRLAPVSGILGFVVVTYLIFLGVYTFLVSLEEERPAVIDKLMGVLLCTAAVVALMALASVVIFTIAKGQKALVKSNLFTQDMRTTGPIDPLSKGGIRHALSGTLIIIALALLFTVPLGLACAVFLNETRSRAGRLVRTVVDAMTALPSILAGLFIFATWILILGFERSGMAAALAVSLMMLPIIIRSADVVLRLVPGNLREAAAALGAPQWRTVWHVVLPTARSGLATSVILGVARGIGETAPVLLTSGVTASTNLNPFEGPMMSLPLATFIFVRSPSDQLRDRAFATAAVLMGLVLILFALARVLGGRPAGRVSPRQARRLAARSRRDLARFEGRPPEGT
jgi:phosphate transport system permease protein